MTNSTLPSTDGATKLGSSEPLGPRYDGTTMDNQQLHAGPGGGMTSPDSSTQRERTVPHEDCLNCRCRPDEQCAGVTSTDGGGK